MRQNAFFPARAAAQNQDGRGRLLKKRRNTTRRALQKRAKAGRLYRLGVLPFHICNNVLSCLPHKQTAPRFKRPHYSRKSINDRCSQESGEDRGGKGIEMRGFFCFFFKLQIALLLCYYIALLLLSRNCDLFTEKIQFSGGLCVVGGPPVGSFMARAVNCVTCSCTSCAIKHSNRLATQ